MPGETREAGGAPRDSGAAASGDVCLSRLTVQNYRNLADVTLTPGTGVNLILGENGAGKTSLLETVYVLGRGRSFRPARVAQLVREGESEFQVTAAVRAGRSEHRLGARRGVRESALRLDGRRVKTVGELARILPVVVFEPHSHELVEGAPEGRRRFLDWGVFHVEPGFLEAWRRYRKALRQRNAALRLEDAQLAASWMPELAAAGTALARMREAYASRLGEALPSVAAELAPGMGPLALAYKRGWAAESKLVEALEASAVRDRVAGYTGIGPHRDDLRLTVSGRGAARRLSRGQEKLAALALCLAQARLFREDTGQRAVLLLDDLPSELDRAHLGRAVGAISALGGQCFFTAVEKPPALRGLAGEALVWRLQDGRLEEA